MNTMPKKREELGINYINPASYGRIFPKFYYVNNIYDSYPNKEITGSVTTGDITNSGWHPLLWDFELVQAQTDNNTGVVRDLKGTYTLSNDEINVESTVPITVRQVGNEKYTHIAEETIPYNKTCVSFAYGAYHPYKYRIKVPNYVSYIQVENNQSWECYTAVLYDLSLNNTEEDREIRIPYDVLNGENIVESGEMVIIQKAPLSVSSTEILVPYEGGEYYVSVNCSGE